MYTVSYYFKHMVYTTVCICVVNSMLFFFSFVNIWEIVQFYRKMSNVMLL